MSTAREPATLGSDFARALGGKDADRLRDLMHPEIDFRGLTRNRRFEDKDEIEALEGIESDDFADCQRVGYRFSVSNPDGRFLVDQQAYLAARDGRIGWMRVLCSGFRPS